MRNRLIVLALALPLCGCLTPQQAATDVQTFLQTANADVAAACQAVQNNCAAIQTAANVAPNLICAAGGNQQAVTAAARAQSIVNSICAIQCGTVNISQISTQVTQAYTSYKAATAGCQ